MEMESNVVYLDDITGCLGEWLQGMEIDSNVPREAIEHLIKAYDICVRVNER